MIIRKVKKILVIDDDPIILEKINNQLSKEEYEVDCIDDPTSAIEKIKRFDYDLILSDLKMEPIDGVELLCTIRKTRPGIPVIILTAYHDEEIKKKVEDIGCSCYLQKPIRKEDLVYAINNAKVIY